MGGKLALWGIEEVGETEDEKNLRSMWYDTIVERNRLAETVVELRCEIHNLKTELRSMKAKRDILKKELTKSESNMAVICQHSESKIEEVRVLEQDLKRATANSSRYKKRLAVADRSGEENAKVARYFRNHLDEGHPEDDNEWEDRARQIMWNEEDARAEGSQE